MIVKNYAVGSEGVITSYSIHYTKLYEITFNYLSLAKLLFLMYFTGDKQVSLTMDRTNWKWGKSNINILMVGVAYKGSAIPLFWEMLDKQGNSNIV